mmetsp:Transcript_13210/g.26811  ORF Transcript_13210/g.26811 Transcript_13210/m.26811 type:complete len:493 (-) Transcript_13210:29-1507(-)
MLLKALTKSGTSPMSYSKKKEGGSPLHDVTVDGESLYVDEHDFELLFKQLSNLKLPKDPSKDPRMSLQEDIVFIQDLVIVIMAAAAGGIAASHFHQPPLIGFIIGGMVVGPGGLGAVTELVEMETLASLGIAFLLFSLGLEFSVSELQSVRRVALFGGLLSMIGIVAISAFVVYSVNLVNSLPEGIALGFAVSLSSTAVVLQCLNIGGNHSTTDSDEKNRKKSPTEVDESLPMSVEEGRHGDIPFDSTKCRKVMLAILVFQDVTIGLILALLPTLRGSASAFAEELLGSSLRLGCFGVLSLAMAEFVIPVVLERLDRSRSNDLFTLGVVVLCLLIAYLSERLGLAIELGAFAAGIMMSESRLKERVESSLETIRDLFSAIFFVAIGMMIHWRYFYMNLFKMTLLLVIVLGVKWFVMTLAVYLFGDLSLRTALACGLSIAQAGEFTFVVASKGQSLQLFSVGGARMLNGATAVSMLLTPLLIRYARRLPRSYK